MGWLDTILGRPKAKRKKTGSPTRPERVTLESPKGRRYSFPASAKAIRSLQRRGWHRVN